MPKLNYIFLQNKSETIDLLFTSLSSNLAKVQTAPFNIIYLLSATLNCIPFLSNLLSLVNTPKKRVAAKVHVSSPKGISRASRLRLTPAIINFLTDAEGLVKTWNKTGLA